MTLSKGSKTNPAFGTTTAQRALPTTTLGVPGPGAYDVRNNDHKNGASSAFKSETKKYSLEEECGDPGMYDPYENSQIAATSSQTFNKTSKPFNSTAPRELVASVFGVDTPGPGKYDAKHPDAETDANASVFRSGTSQRPPAATSKTPGVGTYDPNLNSIKAGATSVAKFSDDNLRFSVDPPQTENAIGPGAYDSEKIGSLSYDASVTLSKGSKTNPAFGVTSAQRALPLNALAVPAPGHYQPMSPRFKDQLSQRLVGNFGKGVVLGSGKSPSKASSKSPRGGSPGSGSGGRRRSTSSDKGGKRAGSAPKRRPSGGKVVAV